MRSKTYELDMCSGAIFPKLIYFAVPLVLSGFLQLLFNAADMVVVGKFGSQNSLAAVGATASLTNLLINVFMGMAVGANAVVARRYGAGDMQGIRRAVHTAVSIGIISGFLLMFMGLFFANPLLEIMGTPDDVINLSSLYLKIYFIGAPFSMFYNFGSAILRAVGDTKRPLYYLTIAGFVNVIFNLVLVIAFGLDVAGVAIATVASQIVSALFVFIALTKHQGVVRLFISEIRIHKVELLQIIQIGIPAAIQSCVFSFSNMIVQSSINYLGTTAIAACAAASSIEGFVYIGMNCFYQTVLSFISQNYGKHDFARIKKIILYSLALVTAVGIVLGLIVVYFHEPLLKLYMSDPNDSELLRLGYQRLVIVALPYFLCGIMEVLVGALRGMGQSFIPMISSIVGACGCRLLWIYFIFNRIRDFVSVSIFGMELGPLQILMLAWPVAWIVTSILHLSVLIYTYKNNVRKIENLKRIPVINKTTLDNAG